MVFRIGRTDLGQLVYLDKQGNLNGDISQAMLFQSMENAQYARDRFQQKLLKMGDTRELHVLPTEE